MAQHRLTHPVNKGIITMDAVNSSASLSMAQVEEELWAAEKYLSVTPSAQGTELTSVHPVEYLANDERAIRRIKDTMAGRARQVISEERRREILSKLSSTRQAAIRGACEAAESSMWAPPLSSSPLSFDERDDNAVDSAYVVHPLGSISEQHADDNVERSSGVMGTPNSRGSVEHEGSSCADSGGSDGELFYASDIIGASFQADINPRSHMDVFYDEEKYTDHGDPHKLGHDTNHPLQLSDPEHSYSNYVAPGPVLDAVNATENHHAQNFQEDVDLCGIDPKRSVLSRLFEQHDAKDGFPKSPNALATDERAALNRDGGKSNHLHNKDFHGHNGYDGSPASHFNADQGCSDPEIEVKTLHEYDSDPSQESFPTQERRELHARTIAARSRLERLAQPRTHIFVQREKQRLDLEKAAMQECTFRPAIGHPAKPRVKTSGQNRKRVTIKPKKMVRFDLPSARRHSTGTHPFPWLMLSPRAKIDEPDLRTPTTVSPRRARNQSLIDRLHLDVTFRYNQREQAKQILDAERMRECTFHPNINPMSRRMLNAVEYKPLPERISDLQRAKSDALQKIRADIAIEQGGYTFIPRINPRSREIANAVLSAKQISKVRATVDLCGIRGTTTSNASDINRNTCGDEHRSNGIDRAGVDEEEEQTKKLFSMLNPPSVTHRLTEDAVQIAEKRMAVQEYYDALETQSFAPAISDGSAQIVKQRPEFQLDFLSRQQYFQIREQEKLEMLEDKVAKSELTFVPNIGNADEVLRVTRPERIRENQQQRLYRMIYCDPKKTELKKQRLRDEEHAKFTFKPNINPISKALTQNQSTPLSSKRGENPGGARSSSAEKKHANRQDLRRYFEGKKFRSRVAMEMDQAEKAECTFRPNLIAQQPKSPGSALTTTRMTANGCSRQKVKSSSTSKLLTKERRQYEGETSIWRSRNILQLIEKQRQERASELEIKRNAQELNELAECTFQPNIRRRSRPTRDTQVEMSPPCARPRPRSADAETSRSSANEERPIIVRGLGRFLELRERAKRQQAEKLAREERIFNPNRAYEPRSYTVPKPFNLSETSKDSIRRRLKARKEMREREQRECTFAPNTLESQHQRVVRNLLNE